MARGISEADVARACDALLLAGERPTIERVRHHLGTGSPNTVGPHLDAWFKGLGARIVNPGAFAVQKQVPDPVQDAAKRLWDLAVAAARSDVEERITQGLADAVASVEAAKERVRIAEGSAYEAAAKAMRLGGELEAATAELQRERLSRAGLEAQLGDARTQIGELQDRDASRQQHLQQAQAAFSADLQLARDAASAADARARDAIMAAETRADAATRRALLEIDQARQALVRAERQRDGLQADIAAQAERSREDQVLQASAAAQLQERLAEATSTVAVLRQDVETAHAELGSVRLQLAAEQRTAGALRAEADTLRQVVRELSASIRPVGSDAPANRGRSRRQQGSRPPEQA